MAVCRFLIFYLIWFGKVLWYINYYWVFNVYAYILDVYMIPNHILWITFLNEPELIFKQSYMISSIALLQTLFNISHLFAHLTCSI